MLAFTTTVSLGACLGVGGCALFKNIGKKQPTEVVYDAPSYEQLGADRTATTADAVTVFTTFNREELPDGVRVSGGGALELDPDFPTTDDAHAVLGVVTVKISEDYESPPRGSESQAEMMDRIAKAQARAQKMVATEAAKHGANAVYIKQAHRGWQGQALYVSSADAEYAPAAELIAALEVPQGYTAGPQQTAALEPSPTFTIKGKRGRCYAVALALDSDARLKGRNRDGLTLDIDGSDQHVKLLNIATPMFAQQRAQMQLLTCPESSGPLTLSLLARGGPKAEPVLGLGTVVMKVYTQKISEKELADRATRRKENWDKTRRQSCYDCQYLRVRCGEDNPRNCRQYVTCLAKRGETINSCREMQ